MSSPLVSVITPSYNRPDAIHRAVKTVSRQTYSPIQHILVDDHSKTPISDIVGNHDGVRVHRHERNKGANAARKTGIDLAEGKYIAFLDDDDEWEKTKIEKQMTRIRDSDAGFVYTGLLRMDKKKKDSIVCPDISGTATKRLFSGNFIGTFSAILLDAELIEQVGYPDETLPSWQDWDYYIRLSQVTTFDVVTEPLTIQHKSELAQISDSHKQKKEETVPRFRNKHSELATEYGCRNDLEAAMADDVGWSAIRQENYGEARQLFLRSLKYNPSLHALLSLGLVLGGRYSFYIGRYVFRKINLVKRLALES